YGVSRRKSTAIVAVSNYVLLSIPAALSFGSFSQELIIFGKTPFDLMDFIASNLLMPLGGMLAAVFVGWRIWPEISEVLGRECPSWVVSIFRVMAGVVSPILIFAVAYFLIFG